MSSHSNKATIQRVEPGNPVVVDLVVRLLGELVEEGDEAGDLDVDALCEDWKRQPDRHVAYAALGDNGSPIGVVTVSEGFAFYAHGLYGIINEMYVVPEHRSSGVGRLLLREVVALGRTRGWRRIDVTAPQSERWARTRAFYEREGFRFTGPKLKLLF